MSNSSETEIKEDAE